MNCINCSNVDLKMIISDVDSLQENRNIKLKYSHNDEENVVNIIDLLIKISMLKKEKSKDHSWKEIALKLIQHFQLDSEENIIWIRMHSLRRMYRNWRHQFNCLTSSCIYRKVCIFQWKSCHEWTWQEKK